tara:strand:+ start:514 stop:795 length:282 start_codon:yes stop_codon:yes gene_type:complete
MKSYGYATNNDQGNFEVFWTEKSTIFSKLFKRPTEFHYWTTSKELKHEKYKSTDAGLYYDWFDMDGNKVYDRNVLTKISKALNWTQIKDCYLR